MLRSTKKLMFKHVRLVSKKIKENVYMMELVCWSMKGISTYTSTPKNLGDEWCKQISGKYLSKQLNAMKNIFINLSKPV